MNVRVGVSFDGFAPLTEAVSFARQAETAGVESLWSAEHLGYRESLLQSMAFAAATTRATVVPTAVSPYLRHPMATAMALATLSEAVPGRVGLALGVGNPLFLQESGVELIKPVRAIREYVECLRALWSGEAVHYAGEIFQLAGARMAFQPPEPVPIYLAPMREQMLRLAGRIGDGVVLSAGLTASHTVKSLGWVAEGARAAGRDPSILRTAGYLLTSVSADGRVAVDAVREKLAFLLRNKFLDENIRSSGIPINQEAIVAAVARRDLDEATRLVPDDAVEAFAVAGTLRHCRERLESYVQSGLNELILFIAGGVEDKGLALSLATEFSRF